MQVLLTLCKENLYFPPFSSAITKMTAVFKWLMGSIKKVIKREHTCQFWYLYLSTFLLQCEVICFTKQINTTK